MKTDGLKKAARLKSNACLSKALAAIDKLKREERAVTFASVSQEAGISRSYLYGNMYLHDLITKTRETQPVNSAAADLNSMIEMQRVEIQRLKRELARLSKIEERAKHLQEENATLKEQLKTDYTY